MHVAPAPSALELTTFQSLGAGIQNLVLPCLSPTLSREEVNEFLFFVKCMGAQACRKAGKHDYLFSQQFKSRSFFNNDELGN